MKQGTWVIGGSVTFATIAFFLYFQHEAPTTSLKEKESLETQIRARAVDAHYIKQHEADLIRLREKGWASPMNRLLAAEWLEHAATALQDFTFTFEPQHTQDFKTPHTYKVTKGLIQFSAVSEDHILLFLKAVQEEFPGILILKKITLSRTEDVRKELEHPNPSLLSGKIEFDWVSRGKEDHDHHPSS